jgi:hypothetical protein
MAGDVPPPTALIAQRVVLSMKSVVGYPQLSLPPVAVGIVMPGVHDGAPETAVHVLPMLPPEDGAQFEPLQQTLGREVWGVHVSGGAQPPVESQRQPWVPTMHVVGAPDVAPVPPPSPPPSTNVASASPVPPSPPVVPESPPQEATRTPVKRTALMNEGKRNERAIV